MLIEFITLAAFLLIVGLVFFLRSLVRGWQGPIVAQVEADARRAAIEPSGPVFGDFTPVLADQIPSIIGTPDNITQDLRRAGYYKPTAPTEFNAIRNVLAIIGILLTGVYAVMVGPERRDLLAPILVWGLTISALLYVIPWFYLRAQASRRVQLIQRGMPDAVDMLSMCLSGGLSLQDSLTHVSREIFFSHPDLAVELEIVRRHAEMNSLGDAFRQFAKRIECPEVTALTGIVTQTEKMGSNLVTSIRDYADGVRLKQRQTADERANKAGIKLLFPLVMCLAPSALIVLWGPAMLELRNFFTTFDQTSQSTVRVPGTTGRPLPGVIRRP